MILWYYAEENAKKGPVSELEFEELIGSGVIQAQTLVWRDGMSDWQPLAAVRPETNGPVVAVEETVPGQSSCCECGRFFPQEDMIHYGNSWVCASCKPIFFQKIQEGLKVGPALNYASFETRWAAKIVDGIIVRIVGLLIIILVGIIYGDSSVMANIQEALDTIFSGPSWTVNFVLGLIYSAGFVGKYGATPGKMLLKLRVVTAEGEKVSYRRAAGRSVAEQVNRVIFYLGYIMAAFDAVERRTLHDRICNTRVIVKK